MLKPLARLSNETEGRYASDQELQVIEDYLDSVEQRIAVYEKLRDSADKIIDRVEQQKAEINPALFRLNERDISGVCKRDLTDLLRCSTGAMLLNDLDYLRDGMLIWYQTIVRAYQYQKHDDQIYKLLEATVKAYLTPAEASFIVPILQLDHTLLS